MITRFGNRLKSLFSCVSWFCHYCCQRLAVWLVADFEALSCQVTTTFETSCDARIRTVPAINYTACYVLAFIHLSVCTYELLSQSKQVYLMGFLFLFLELLILKK